MGLDMFAYAVTDDEVESSGEKGINIKLKRDDTEEFFYWRKHPNLHGWMENLYRERGGEKQFNSVAIELYPEDIANLKEDIENNNLPYTCGFFFGESGSDYKDGDIEFIEKAEKAIDSGSRIIYSSRW